MRRRLAADLFFAVPGDIETRTGGTIYDRRLLLELRRSGWSVEHLRWAANFPFPTPADVARAAQSLAACADDSLVLVDGLAFGAVPALAEAEGQRLRLVALVHHPLALETGLVPSDRDRLARWERRALQSTRAVITTSAATAKTLIGNYGVSPERLTVAEPGTDPVRERSKSARAAGTSAHLLSVGSVTPRKGHDLLIEALAGIADMPWTCTIVGSLDRAPGTAADIRARIAAHGLSERIALLGEIADVAPLYEAANLFVLASQHEGYGMAFAEALRHGVPVVGTTAGAISAVVPPSAGVLVSPNDVPALAAALRHVIGNPARCDELAAGARTAGANLPRWSDTAARVAAALRKLGASPTCL